MLGLIGLGVLGPPLFREIGWLKDGDDFTRHVLYRACFHALMTNVILVTAIQISSFYLGPPGDSGWAFHDGNMHRLSNLTLKVFDMGSPRSTMYSSLLLVGCVLQLALAWIVNRWPRIGGAILLVFAVLMIVPLGFVLIVCVKNINNENGWQFFQVYLMTGLFIPIVFSSLGIVLLRHDGDQE